MHLRILLSNEPRPSTSFFAVTKVSDAHITTCQGLCNVYLELYPTYNKSWALKSDMESRLLTVRQESDLRTGSGTHPAFYPVRPGSFSPGLKRPECGAGHIIYFWKLSRTYRRRPRLMRVFGCSDESASYFTTYSNCSSKHLLTQHSSLAPHIICRYVSSSLAAGRATHTGQVLRRCRTKGDTLALQAVGWPDILSS